MSRGGYTEAIDMWGCGCVLGELLQRVAWIGKATTPQLQVNCGAARTFGFSALAAGYSQLASQPRDSWSSKQQQQTYIETHLACCVSPV